MQDIAHPTPDWDSLIEGLKRLERSPLTHKARRWVPLVDVMELIRQHEAGLACARPQSDPSEIWLKNVRFAVGYAKLHLEREKYSSNKASHAEAIKLLGEAMESLTTGLPTATANQEPESTGEASGRAGVGCSTTEPVSGEPQRCNHGVWPYDHCYACEEEAATGQPVGFSDCEKAMAHSGYHKMSPVYQIAFRDGWEARILVRESGELSMNERIDVNTTCRSAVAVGLCVIRQLHAIGFSVVKSSTDIEGQKP